MNISIQELERIKKNIYFDCYQENIISPLCIIFDIDIKINFLNLFRFNVNLESLSDDILRCDCINGFQYRTENVMDCMKDFGGIKIKKYTDNTKCFEKHSEIYGILIDSYFLPWNKYFNKTHRLHYILILKEGPSDILIYDKYLSNNLITCKKEMIFENCLEFLNITKVPKRYSLYYNIEDYIINGTTSNINIQRYNNIIKLVNNIKKVEINNVYKITELKELLFIDSITWMYNYRLNFKGSIDYYIKKQILDEDFLDYYLLEKICHEWKELKQDLIVKILRNSQKNMGVYIYEKIYYIAQLEYIFIDSLLKN